METKTMKNVLAFGIIVAAVLIGMTFIMSSSAYAAVAAPSAGAAIVRSADSESFFAPRLAPRPFIGPRPFFGQRPFFRPDFNPFFFPRFNPFLFEDFDNPFFFNEEVGFGEERDD